MLMSKGVVARGTDLGSVEDRIFTIREFRLQNGTAMPQVELAYETYGRLAPDGSNAVLITHGYTSSHHAAGRNPANGNQPGWWDGLIGPGKAIDTDRLFVVSSNMLGSSFGSTNGASINPGTGKPYGPDFPAITVRDIVAAEKALLDGLGVKHLVAVAGPSYGGYQAFQWAVCHADFVDAIIPVVTAPRAQNVERSLTELQSRLANDPEWNGGWYYDKGGAKAILTELRVEMLKRNGIEAALAGRYPDRESREATIRQQACDWAKSWDANSLIILRRGTIGYDTVKDFPKIKAKSSTSCAGPTGSFRPRSPPR
jgi:homoserine O-acetyltransferase/O-succinyltransferase